MTGAYIDNEYVYAVARIRGKEQMLLNSQAINELITCLSSEMVVNQLREKGWGKESDIKFDDIIKSEREKLWELVDELVPNREKFAVLRISDDYHNLKAAIKESILEYPYEGIYIEGATFDYRIIRDSIKNKNFDNLPNDMKDVAVEALDVLLKTQDGQLCDMIIDKACLEAILKASENQSNQFLKTYAKLLVASSDIKICVRACLTGKDKEWMDRALVDVDSINVSMLSSSAIGGVDNMCNYLSTTEFADAVPEIKKSLTAFEKWCDDLVIDRIKSQLMESFGIGPIAAYILAKENEIKTVRIIYTCIQNGFKETMIRERVRETYV